MSTWRNITININNIKNETGSAVLFGMPKNGKYSGYDFWHPAKCVRRSYKCNGFVSVGYTEDWEFKLKKYGKGKWNKSEVIDEITISVEDFEEAFANMNDHACSFSRPKVNLKETHKPEPIEPEPEKVLEELKDE